MICTDCDGLGRVRHLICNRYPSTTTTCETCQGSGTIHCCEGEVTQPCQTNEHTALQGKSGSPSAAVDVEPS